MEPVTQGTRGAAIIAQTPGLPGKAAASAAQRPAVAVEAKPAAPTEKDTAQAIRKVEKFVQSISADLQFSLDGTSGAYVVRVIDRTTKEVIRQIPSEEMVSIANALDRLQGLLLRQQA